MSITHREEIINKFIAIVQCSRRIATQCLEAAKWNEEVAVGFFFDSEYSQASNSFPSMETRPFSIQNDSNVVGDIRSSNINASDTNQSSLKFAVEENLHLKSLENPIASIPKQININKSLIAKINTSNLSDDGTDDEDPTFYVDGSEHSGQQIIESSKNKECDEDVTNVLKTAFQQGAREIHETESNVLAQIKEEKSFAGIGCSLGENNTPAENLNQSTVTFNQVEELPIRFYSNGFTVGDGDLRKFEDNIEFIDYIKRGDVPPELNNINTGGRQIQASLEDHRSEEYKRIAPVFKPFSGAGHAIGLPESEQRQLSSSTTSHVHRIREAFDASVLEKLAEINLKTASSSSTTIRLRLPDISTPIRIQLDVNRTLADVRKFLHENVASLQSNSFEFMEPPSAKIKREDEKQKICDTKLPNSTLVVRRTV